MSGSQRVEKGKRDVRVVAKGFKNMYMGEYQGCNKW